LVELVTKPLTSRGMEDIETIVATLFGPRFQLRFTARLGLFTLCFSIPDSSLIRLLAYGLFRLVIWFRTRGILFCSEPRQYLIVVSYTLTYA
jgi:hypothetical protein